MKTENGDISITAARKITIKAGDKITLVMNGESGKVTLKCQDLSVDATGKIQQQATGKMNLSGAMFTAETQGAMKLNASGLTQITGATIKIG